MEQGQGPRGRPDVRRMARGLRAEGQRAIELLATGPAGYAVKAPSATAAVPARGSRDKRRTDQAMLQRASSPA